MPSCTQGTRRNTDGDTEYDGYDSSTGYDSDWGSEEEEYERKGGEEEVRVKPHIAVCKGGEALL